MPTPEHDQSIWAQRGAPRPMAKRGRIQEWDLERREKIRRMPIQRMRKKKMTRRTIW
jgi:hypothetical protein